MIQIAIGEENACNRAVARPRVLLEGVQFRGLLSAAPGPARRCSGTRIDRRAHFNARLRLRGDRARFGPRGSSREFEGESMYSR